MATTRTKANQRGKAGVDEQTIEADGKEPSMAELMAELKSQRSEILGRLDGIDTRLEKVNNQVATIKEGLSKTNKVVEQQKQRMDEAEQRISTLEDTLLTTQRQLHRAEKQLKTMEAKTDKISNKEKRKHLVLLGLAEKSEGEQNLYEYIQQKLPSWLNLPLEKPLELEQVFRPARSQKYTGKHPRPVLIHFLRLGDKELILRTAKNMTISEGESKLTIRQDLPAEVRRKRKEFHRAIKILIEKDMFRGFIYPHRLRVLQDDKIVLFDEPKAAELFVDGLEPAGSE